VRLARLPAWLVAVLLVLATVLAYQPVWHAGFIWDDDALLTANPLVQTGWHGLRDIWSGTKYHDFVPLTLTTFWVEWHLWADDPLGYHLVNVALHALSAVLLWRVLKRLSIPGAALAAAFFAVHPVNAESVAWIAERKNTLAMVFYLISLLLYLQSEDAQEARIEDGGLKTERAPSSLLYCLSLLSFALALLSKTAVAPLPLVLLGLAWLRRGRVGLRDLVRSLPYFALAAATALACLWFQHQVIGATLLGVRHGTFGSRLAGAGWALWFYLDKALLPLNLSFVYPRWRIEAANLLSWLPSLLLVLAFAACWRYRRGWGRPVLFALAYFVLMLLPALGFVNIYFMQFSLVADHWQYFSIIGPLALVASALAAVGARRPCSVVLPAIGGALIALLSLLTWNQAHIYANQETLWRDTLARNPACWMAQINLANVLNEKGQVDQAIAHYREALRLQPKNADALYNIGTALLSKGQTDDAIAQFREALRVQPNHVNAHINLGFALLGEGQVAEAITILREATRMGPNDPLAHANLGVALQKDGQLDEAISQFLAALRLKPGDADLKSMLTSALELKRRSEMRTHPR
jgi:tetratricopeptide (TPR) repeat protein